MSCSYYTYHVIFSGCEPQDIVFILDSSTSVNEINFGKMLQFTKDFIGGADVNSGNVRVGLLLYGTTVHVEFHLGDFSTKGALFSAINSVKYKYGSTNTAEALRILRTEMFLEKNGDRPSVRNIAVVVTDGVSNVRARRTIPEANLAKADGIHIYTVGIGLADLWELDGMATPPAEENRFSVRDFDGLSTLQEELSSSICPGCCFICKGFLKYIVMFVRLSYPEICFVFAMLQSCIH